MEQNILDATEYILMAMNNITTIEDFMDYKEEIIKALMDIRNIINTILKNKSTTYKLIPKSEDIIVEVKKEDETENSNQFNTNTNNTDNNIEILNTNEQIEKSPKIDKKEEINKETKSPSISSILGLKFNYDEYFKENDLLNFTENNSTNSITNNNDIQNIINKSNNITNNNNEIQNIINNNDYIMKKNNNILGIENQNNNNDNNIEPEPTPSNFEENYENICCNKSLRNKGTFINDLKSNSIIYNNHVKNTLSENLERSNENFTINNNTKLKTTNYFHSKKEKISMIADIIMLMNNDDYIYEILTKLFGNDLTDKLMSSSVDDDLLQSIDKAIKEIQRLKEKDKIQSENKNINNIPKQKLNINTDSDFYIAKSAKSQNHNLNRIKNNNTDPYQEFNFKKSLRNNNFNEFKRKNSRSKGSKGKNESKNSVHSFLLDNKKKDKPFITATSAYGKYFDEPLQKGGLSKLHVCNKSQRQFYSSKNINDKKCATIDRNYE